MNVASCVGSRATGRQSPAQPALEGLSQGILHSWQGILCGFRRNARLCTGTQGWIVRSPKMQLDGNRVILSCVLTIIASFKMFQLEGRGSCVSQPSSGDYRALPTTIACKCKLKGAPEPQSYKTSAKLLNPSISDMDVLHVILRYLPKNVLHCIITKCTPTSPKMTVLVPRKVIRQHHQILLPPQRVQPHPILQLRRRALVCH